MGISSLPLEHLLSSTSPEDFSARRHLSDISTCIAKAKKVIVVSGAGISCSSGIPVSLPCGWLKLSGLVAGNHGTHALQDFRSDDGLYALVKARYPDHFFSGKDLFSSGLFSNPSTTAIFYTFIAELTLACNNASPTRTHHFINKLERAGKLLRSYTQNVDGLERRLGLESGGRGKGLDKRRTRNVELHGDLGRVRCTLCFEDYAAQEDWTGMFREGESPDCPKCEERSHSRVKRSARATAVGTLRPSIVLYDEPHPLGDDIADLQTWDLSKRPDVLLIMGTSLKVHGLKQLVKSFAKSIHTPDGKGRKGTVIFVNATKPSKEWEGVIDVHVEGTSDQWVERVEEEWRKIRPADWEIQTRLDEELGLPQVVAMPVAAGSKPKAKRAPKAPKHTAATVFDSGFPSPRPTASPCSSPRRTPVRSSDASASPSSSKTPISEAPSSPLTPLSPESLQLSPSKRRANRPVSPGLESPSKKRSTAMAAASRDVDDAPLPPATGMPSTPGRGNLFGTSSEANRHDGIAQLPTPPSSQEEDIFGSPAKASARPARKARLRALTGTRKENADALGVDGGIGPVMAVGKGKRIAVAPASRPRRGLMVEIPPRN